MCVGVCVIMLLCLSGSFRGRRGWVEECVCVYGGCVQHSCSSVTTACLQDQQGAAPGVGGLSQDAARAHVSDCGTLCGHNYEVLLLALT